MFKDKIILITGGSGSFGNAMIERLLKKDIKEIRVFSRNEKLQVDTKTKFNDERVKFIVGDVRNYNSIAEACVGVDYVFHAGAMKHIDKCSQFPLECINTNVAGSINVLLACVSCGVKKVVLLSTDKATNATTTYGATKFLMERLGQELDTGKTEVITTRYGNVLGSNGSVVQIFREKVKQNVPLTITDPNMTRFFMTLDEAVNLVLFALKKGKHRDLFVFNNKSCTLKELADCFSDNQIITGTRGIEKTDEALLTSAELHHAELIDNKYWRVANDIYNAEEKQPLTSDNAERFTKEELEELIKNA